MALHYNPTQEPLGIEKKFYKYLFINVMCFYSNKLSKEYTFKGFKGADGFSILHLVIQ